jgi:hypothetical protein
MQREMKRNNRSEKQKKNHTAFTSVILILCLLLLLSFSSITVVIPVQGTSYIPAPPQGTSFGFVNVDYKYHIVTINYNASWRFDWGDGTLTPWLQLSKGETVISQVHHWSTQGTYLVRVQFRNEQILTGVWSTPLEVSISVYSSEDYPAPPALMSGTIQGFSGDLYYYAFSPSEPTTNQVSYSIDWGTGYISEWTSYVSSTTVFVVPHIWETRGEFFIKAKLRNQYNLESSWSFPRLIIMKNITDINASVIDLIVLNGIEDHITYFSKGSGIFYNASSKSSSDIQSRGNGEYLLDDDTDGRFEHLYIPESGQVQPYQDQIPVQKNFFSDLPWMLILIISSIVLGVIGVIFVLVRMGYIYITEEPVVRNPGVKK